jgi:hypothetical protein
LDVNGSALSARADPANHRLVAPLLGLTPVSGTATADRLEFDGIDLRHASTSAMAQDARRAHLHGDAGSEVLIQSGDDHRQAN